MANFRLFPILVAAFNITATGTDGQPACNRPAATALMERAMADGTITTVSMMNRTATIHVDRAAWAGFPLDVRQGMFLALECAVAGPGNVLRAMQVVDQGGRVLATFDGIRRRMDIRE